LERGSHECIIGCRTVAGRLATGRKPVTNDNAATTAGGVIAAERRANAATRSRRKFRDKSFGNKSFNNSCT
jgi:hypothetical protein